MKLLLPVLFVTLCVSSCKKDVDQEHHAYLTKVKEGLRDSLLATDYHNLAFAEAVLTRVDSVGLYLLQAPFKGKTIATDFVLVQTDKNGRLLKGKLVHLEGENDAVSFNGAIRIRSLKGQPEMASPIKNGYIILFHSENTSLRTESLTPSQYKLLPEVVVSASYSSSGVYFSTWIYLQGLLGSGGGSSNGSSSGGSGGGGSFSGYYSPRMPIRNEATQDGERYTKAGTSGVREQLPVLIDFENGIQNPAVEVAMYLNCFTAIPDGGASCSIELFADIPVDTDPNKLFNWQTESPGHSFIQLKKMNGTQTIVQNIGFYPQKNWKVTLTPAPVAGKFVDNGGHEFNAAIKMEVSPENFKSILSEILYLSRFVRYDIDEYNCTDFALDVFNKVRTKKLEIPMYDIPGGITAGGTRTPQGIYHKLKQMKENNDPETGNINIGFLKGWVANSHGPCN